MAPTAERATGAEVGAEVGAGCTKGNQVFAKVKRRSATTPYTHDARNTRRTTHAVPLAGKAWRQNLYTEVSWLHRGPATTAARP